VKRVRSAGYLVELNKGGMSVQVGLGVYLVEAAEEEVDGVWTSGTDRVGELFTDECRGGCW
jgi:hypothetical protein